MRAVWRKSSYSQGPTGDCVEIAFRQVVAVRDSKNTAGPMLDFPPDNWRVFLRSTWPGSHA